MPPLLQDAIQLGGILGIRAAGGSFAVPRPDATAGDYPIHIVVKHGRITLLGVVDTDADRTVAGLRAREVPGAFGVENELTVHRQGPAGTSSSR